MVKKEVVISNKSGLHARPANEFAKAASRYRSTICIRFKEREYNAKSIIHVISAGMGFGSEICLVAEGEDEAEAVEVLARLINSKFDE